MFQQLEAQPADALLALIQLFASDDRADKIDLGVGVFRTETGATPVFKAIKLAEQKLIETQDSKSYLGPAGDKEFVTALMPHFLHGFTETERLDGVQTPGGTGAVRLAVELVKEAGCTKILLGNPSWPNHAQIIKAVGVEAVAFRHMDVATQMIDIDSVMDALNNAEKGDAILLHGCCHNPSGAEYSNEQWQQIADKCAETGVFPIVDVAYQGLGQGFEDDAKGLNIILNTVPEALICYSCDKNFGLYRDRVGALYAMTKSADDLPLVMSNINAMARANWSMPPDHGAAAARIILTDSELTEIWTQEVSDMRARMQDMRKTLSSHGKIGNVDLEAVGRQNGMFAMLALDKAQIQKLREDFGIYMAGSGRINIAGLTKANIPHFIKGLKAVA